MAVLCGTDSPSQGSFAAGLLDCGASEILSFPFPRRLFCQTRKKKGEKKGGE